MRANVGSVAVLEFIYDSPLSLHDWGDSGKTSGAILGRKRGFPEIVELFVSLSKLY